MIVGLGTGRTASRAIIALADRVREDGLDIKCVPTSHVTETLARQLRLNVVDFAMIERVDLLFDGADEVDPSLRMLKGAGGAMTRERIVAHAADRRIYMVHENKLVERLGTKAPLSACILAFGLAAIREHLRSIGLNGVVRRSMDGHLFLTDNGNLVLDFMIEDQDIEELSKVIDSVPGVVDHGIFLSECDELVVEKTNGAIDRVIRSDLGK